VPHAGLSGAPGTIALTASSRWHRGGKTTRLSGVKYGLSGVKYELSGVKYGLSSAKIMRANGHLR
jgi:hypothetical protein